MPRYNFKCEDEDHPVFEVDMTIEDLNEVKDGNIIVSCPVCGGRCKKTFLDMEYHGYVAGDGYKDKSGAKRDMERHTLRYNDPYKHMRTKEDKEHIMKQLGYNESDPAWAEASVYTYKVCPSCGKTMPSHEFNRGTDNRCNSCTPDEELQDEPKTRLEHDKDLFLRYHSEEYKKERAEKQLKEQKEDFKKEFGFDPDDDENLESPDKS